MLRQNPMNQIPTAIQPSNMEVKHDCRISTPAAKTGCLPLCTTSAACAFWTLSTQAMTAGNPSLTINTASWHCPINDAKHRFMTDLEQ